MKIVKIILGTFFIAAALQSCSPKSMQGTEKSETKEKTTSVIKKQIETGAFVVDVRTPVEYKLGHFEGAVNIPLGDVESRLKEFEGKENIIVYCRSGNRSGKAKGILEQNGFKNVTNGINQANLEEKTK